MVNADPHLSKSPSTQEVLPPLEAGPQHLKETEEDCRVDAIGESPGSHSLEKLLCTSSLCPQVWVNSQDPADIGVCTACHQYVWPDHAGHSC